MHISAPIQRYPSKVSANSFTAHPEKLCSALQSSWIYCESERLGSRAIADGTQHATAKTASKPRKRTCRARSPLRKILEVLNYHLGAALERPRPPTEGIEVHAERFDTGRRNTGAEDVLRKRGSLRGLVRSAGGP